MSRFQCRRKDAKYSSVVRTVIHGIKRDHVRHIREPRFDGNFIFARVEAEHARRAGIGPEQVQQHLMVVVLPAPLRPKKP